ncbi:mitochondrial import inner membrane translocase subunit Tim21 [Topomyia yanbarensis]|uniref:mitochondrial import inner membrane translocase subunit Tim21 n=1 Tax=Topomyia yanbarensis TaxID=2498891 RepID=UPI00273CEA5A|nr:mitochondrial import inner membrane translocase subunit Tim21 [Topomyia yanbarensis]XP_058818312.1 mitochondrial import inner membrane translocase subunit Tim21 [Topomyia yanbarensis]XP_058818313.1 mitochondrial import inner membrane translocase subunit Tim21 [Topomyia yanbarensis]XP_058818314.1 mitochondrial import inner membrane translocase subunit Tim21 [Topomyia yanbarensis]
MSLLALRPLLSRNRIHSVYLFRLTTAIVTVPVQQVRCYAEGKRSPGSSSLAASASGRTDVSTDIKPLGERVKENTKTASYMGVILLGVGVTGILFYAIFRELFSSNSPNSVYTDALERVKNEAKVKDSLGAPIKGFGEENSRGRRKHVAHTTYVRDGVQYLRMQFYVQGIRNKATVHLEKKMNESGDYEYRYLFVQLDYYPHTTIILEDNRLKQDGQKLESGLQPIF